MTSTNNNNATAVKTTKEQMVEIVANKDAKDLTPEDRVYYGIPRWRGATAVDSEGNTVVGCGYICVISNEARLARIEQSTPEYKEFLQDFFYRKFMGYENHYFRTPKTPRLLRIYNETAVECGHPEYAIRPGAVPEIEDKKSEQHTESSESVVVSQVDVLDKDGKVIAEGCEAGGTTSSKKPAKAEEKKDHPKQEKKDEAKKAEPTSAKKGDAKDEKGKKESNAESCVIFTEVDPNGRILTVDKNRHNEFAEVNAPVIKQYPELEKLVKACKKHNKLVCLRFKDPDTKVSFNGLIHATIFDKGVPGKGHEVLIDPAKVRDHYSFIRPAVIPGQVFPFECPMVSFDRYLDKYIATNGNLSAEDAAAVDTECLGDYKFLYHLAYSSVPSEDLQKVAVILAPLFHEIDKCNLSLRFRAIDYTSKYSFTLLCAENVNLGKYARDNAKFAGLRIAVRVASEKSISLRAMGKHAQEFRDIIFDNSLGAFDMKVSSEEPEQSAGNPKQGKKHDKKDSKQKQQKPKQELEVDPAEVVTVVEQEQKPIVQTTDKSPEEKAAEAKRAANFAEAVKNQQQQETSQIIEASNGIH